MLICCSKTIYYYQCWTPLYCLIFLWKLIHLFIWFFDEQSKKIFEIYIFCNIKYLNCHFDKLNASYELNASIIFLLNLSKCITDLFNDCCPSTINLTLHITLLKLPNYAESSTLSSRSGNKICKSVILYCSTFFIYIFFCYVCHAKQAS